MGKRRRAQQVDEPDTKRHKEEQTVADLLYAAESDEDSGDIHYDDFFDGDFEEPDVLDETRIDKLVEGRGGQKEDELSDSEARELAAGMLDESDEEDDEEEDDQGDTDHDEEESDEDEEQVDDDISESPEVKNLIAMQRGVDDEIEQLELSLIQDKHWTMRGEAYAHEREKNSLLEEHLELPQFNRPHTASGHEVDGLGDAKTSKSPSSVDKTIETIVIRRIHDQLFDDPVRVAAPDPNEAKKAQDAEDELAFQKSKLSLAEIYAHEYENKILKLGEKTKAAQEDESRREITALFAEVMMTLDNAVFDNKVRAF